MAKVAIFRYSPKWQTQREREAPAFRPFRKQSCSFGIATQVNKKGDIDVKGLGTMKKECLHNVTMAELEESTHHPACYWPCCKKAIKGKILGKKMCTLSILHTHVGAEMASQNWWGDIIRTKGSQREGTGAQLNHQPSSPREAHFVRTKGREPVLNAHTHTHIQGSTLLKIHMYIYNKDMGGGQRKMSTLY